MKPQILEKLAEGNLGFKQFIRLVFIRVIKVTAVCLVISLIFWFIWLDEFTLGSFFAGAASGFFVFLIYYSLKRLPGNQQTIESPEGTEKKEKPADPDQIEEKAPVKD
jgi:hypothetical protein